MANKRQNGDLRSSMQCMLNSKPSGRGFKAVNALGMRESIAVAIVLLALLVAACSSSDGTTVSQCWTDDEAQYFETLRGIDSRFFNSSKDMELLMAAAIEDPSLFDDGAWRMDVTFALAGYSLMATELHALDPPESVRSIHHGRLVAAQEFEGFSVMFASWMGTGHTDTLNEALNYQKQANKSLKDTFDKVKGFCE